MRPSTACPSQSARAVAKWCEAVLQRYSGTVSSLAGGLA